MKTKLFGLACFVGVILGGAAYLVIHWATDSFFSTTENMDVLASPSPQESQRRIDEKIDLPELVTEENLLVRNIELRKNLVGLDVAQLLHLLERTDELERDQDVSDIQDLLIESIARIDPKIALEKVWTFKFERWNSLVSSVFAEWTSMNLHQALQTAASLMGTPRKVALNTILETGSDTTEILKVAELIGIVPDVEIALSELKVIQTLNDPNRAFDLVFSDTVSDFDQEKLLIAIGESWASKEGTDMFFQFFDVIIEQYEATRENDRENLGVLSNLVEAIATYNPEHMWKLVLSKSADIRYRFASPVIEAWAKKDLQQALEALEELDQAELQGRIYRSLFRALAIQEPLTTLNNIEDVRVEHRPNTIGSAIRQIFRKSGAHEAIDYLTALEEQGENVSLATRYLSEEWAKLDPHATISWILSKTADDDVERARLLRETLGELSIVDPHRALSIAQENSDLGSLSLEVLVLDSVSYRGDIETAKSLLENVREAERRTAYLSVGRNLIHSNMIEEAVTLVDEFPSNFQTDYFGDLAMSWFQFSPDTLVASASNLSSENAQALARVALQFNSLYPRFTKQEIAILKSFVSDE